MTPFADTLADRHEVAIRFEIHEGEKVKITVVQFVGVHGVAARQGCGSR